MIRTFDNFLTTIANGNDDIFFMLLSDKYFKTRGTYELLRDHASDLSGIDYHHSKADELSLTVHTSTRIALDGFKVDAIRARGYTVEVTQTNSKIELYLRGEEPSYEHKIDY